MNVDISNTSSNISSSILNVTEIYSNHSFRHFNSSYPTEGSEFFFVYYSTTRFIVETILLVLAATSNGIMLIAVGTIRRKQHASTTSNIRLVFLHMTAVNVLCCATLWLSNNLLVLFGRQMAMIYVTSVCRFLIYPTSALFAASSFGFVSKLSMLGFCCVQYFAVCHPLRHRKDQVRRKLVLFLVLSWTFSLVVGFLPAAAFKVITVRHLQCQSWIRRIVLKVLSSGVVAGSCFDAVIYAAIVLFCLGIHHRMRVVRREMARFQFSSDARCEMKAIVVVVAIMTVLNLYSVSHILIHVLSLNGYAGLSVDNDALIYYMNMSPYVKLMIEPIVYGLRMHEIHELLKLSKARLDRYLHDFLAATVCTGCCSKDCRTSGDSPLVMTSYNITSPPVNA